MLNLQPSFITNTRCIYNVCRKQYFTIILKTCARVPKHLRATAFKKLFSIFHLKLTRIILLCNPTSTSFNNLMSKTRENHHLQHALPPPRTFLSPLTLLTGKDWCFTQSVQEWLVGCFWPFSYVYTIN